MKPTEVFVVRFRYLNNGRTHVVWYDRRVKNFQSIYQLGTVYSVPKARRLKAMLVEKYEGAESIKFAYWDDTSWCFMDTI